MAAKEIDKNENGEVVPMKAKETNEHINAFEDKRFLVSLRFKVQSLELEV